MSSARQERIVTQTPSEADFGSPSERGITFRSVGLGVLIVIAINLWVTYAETVVHASRLHPGALVVNAFCSRRPGMITDIPTEHLYRKEAWRWGD